MWFASQTHCYEETENGREKESLNSYGYQVRYVVLAVGSNFMAIWKLLATLEQKKNQKEKTFQMVSSYRFALPAEFKCRARQ